MFVVSVCCSQHLVAETSRLDGQKTVEKNIIIYFMHCNIHFCGGTVENDFRISYTKVTILIYIPNKNL